MNVSILNSNRASAQGRRAIRTLTEWRFHSSPGDVSRVIWAPVTVARAFYGSPISENFCLELKDIIGGGDLALVNIGDEIIASMPLENFQTLAVRA